MDQAATSTLATPLAAFVDELRRHDRFQAFARALPTKARVSEPVLPLLLAALHEELGRGLLVLLPEDADARDAAEAAGWFLGGDRVALLPSRGVSYESGLVPPPHLVGERYRALDTLAAGGLVCASARALADGLPPVEARPSSLEFRVGDEPGVDGLAEQLALAGYERVDRVDERGQFAVRGGLVDVFPSTGREPLRVDFFGDEIEQVRAFSPFTQRALHTADQTTVYPAAERRARPRRAGPRYRGGRCGNAGGAGRSRPARRSRPDLVWQPDDVRRVGDEEGLAVDLDDATELDPFPQGQPHRFEAQRPAIAARGIAEAENELQGLVRAGNRVVVAFAHRGEAERQRALLRKVDGPALAPGEALPVDPDLRFAVAPARRGFVWRELGLVLLPDTQVFRKKPARADARLGRALASFADLRVGDHVVHEDHGVGKLLGFDTKAVAGVTRDYLHLAFRGEDRLFVPHEQVGKLSRYIGADATAPTLSKLGGKAWQNLKARARAAVQELAGELLQLYAQRQRAAGTAFEVESDWLEQLEASFPYRETDDQQRAIEAVKEDLESPQPMDRLVCGDVGFGKTEVAVRAAFAVAVNRRQVLVLCPTTILAEQHWNTFRERYRDFPVRVEMVSRFRRPAEVKAVLKEFAEGKVDVLVGTHRILSRDVIPKQLGLVVVDEEQRFGVAAEGAAARAAARGRRAVAVRDADPAHAAHVPLGAARHLDHRDPSRGEAADPDDGGRDRRRADPARARARARTRGPVLLPPQPRRDDRRGGREAPAALPGPSLPRRARADGRARARGADARLPRRRRGRSRLDHDHRVGDRHPAGEHARRRAGRRARARAALPDPRPCRPLGRHRPRVPLLSRRQRAHGRVARPTGDARRPHRARRRLPDRDARPRDPGAGDLLGAEQSGHVAALGFELYVEMLNEAVAELCGQERVIARPVRIDARVDAFVPATYIQAEALKIDLHRRIALAEHEDELRELRAATEDRYGPLPEPVENLFRIQETKLALAPSAPTTSSSAAGAPPSGPSGSRRRSFARCARSRTPRSTPRPGRRSRSAPRGSTVRSAWPLLSLPRAGPPEHVRSDLPPARKRISRTQRNPS